jgi:uncharacterized membrane protein YoaK (UPF0700 family)
MILITILLLTALILTAFVVFAISVGGAIFTVVFGDVIVCVALIIGLTLLIARKKRRKKR